MIEGTYVYAGLKCDDAHLGEYPRCPRCGGIVAGAMMTSNAIEKNGVLYYHPDAVSVYWVSAD